MSGKRVPRELYGDYPGQIASMVEKVPGGCWHYTGSICKQGYGRLGHGVPAHRVAWEVAHGVPVPSGLVVDHACHNADPTCHSDDDCMHRRCINPDHLEAVAQVENVMRGHSAIAANIFKTVCPANHPYDAANTYVRPDRGTRECRACRRAARAAWGERDRTGAA